MPVLLSIYAIIALITSCVEFHLDGTLGFCTSMFFFMLGLLVPAFFSALADDFGAVLGLLAIIFFGGWAMKNAIQYGTPFSPENTQLERRMVEQAKQQTEHEKRLQKLYETDPEYHAAIDKIDEEQEANIQKAYANRPNERPKAEIEKAQKAAKERRAWAEKHKKSQ